MNVSSLTPWLLDFHTVQFSGSSGYLFFVFRFVVVLLLVVQGGKVYPPTPPSWLEVPLLFVPVLFVLRSSCNSLCGCARRQSMSTYASILTGSPLLSFIEFLVISLFHQLPF